jgi:hypothetical protein
MPAGPRPRRDPTDDWDQLRLLTTSPAQETYELLRPIVLFGQPPAVRARETGVPERTLRRKAARFDAHGHPVQCPKLTDGDGLNCDPASRSRRDDDAGMSLVMIWGATRRWRSCGLTPPRHRVATPVQQFCADESQSGAAPTTVDRQGACDDRER